MTSYEEHETFIIALGAAICGIYLGSAWRGAHERWEQQVWRFFKPEGWISERARRVYADRNKLLGYWLIRCFLKVIFLSFGLACGGLFFTTMGALLGSSFSRWLTLPAIVIIGVFLSILPMAPYLIYKKLASRKNNFWERMEADLKLANDLSSEIPKLQEWNDKQQRLINAGLASLDKSHSLSSNGPT